MKTMFATSAAVTIRMRRYRLERGWSVQKLADAITAAGYRVERSVLANQEAGRKQTVPVDLVVIAALVLDIPVQHLLADAPCRHCQDAPPPGFTCNSCGEATA